jgi:4-amino-4-deoxy-L-arabinose transferase-like glycosyltransferase
MMVHHSSEEGKMGSILASGESRAAASDRPGTERWQIILFWAAIVALFAVAVGMRLYDLGLPFDRDTYDEGVYWQSLRAMSAGHPLYQQIFYSQPPFFLLSTFPSYVLFGGTLWSARFGIALVSLFGLLGAVLLGKALSGRLGAIAALLLVVVNPLYLAQSQTIQAEVSCVAFSLLAVGLGYLWWEHPAGIPGIALAGLAGIALSLSILCKLFGVAALAPLTLLMLARLWLIWRRPGAATRFSRTLPILVGIGTAILTILLVMLPFISSLNTLLQSVIFFHASTTIVAGSSQQGNIGVIGRTVHSILAFAALYSILALAALYGTLAAFLRRDWRVFPLLAWLFVTAFLLWRQVPLFPHHFVILTAPLIALAVMGIGRMPAVFKAGRDAPGKHMTWLTIFAILLIFITMVLNVGQDLQYYRVAEVNSTYGVAQQEAGQQALRAAADLRQAITPNQLVVTDAQFVAALADRSTPPTLVDTSQVRLSSGYLTLSELIDITSESQVHAVLFFTGRFQSSEVAAFHDWVAHHFHLLHNYGGGKELWVR